MLPADTPLGRAGRVGRIALLAVLLGGCTTLTTPGPGEDPDFAAVIAEPEPPAPAPASGSIYNTSAAGRSGRPLTLFEDARANRVGDILTVILREQTSAEKSANTSTEREASAGVSVTSGFGDESADSDSEFEGESEADQSNRLDGSITVTVAEVLPSGSLVVRGEKWLTINHGREYLRLRGIVRPEDIEPDNTVLSTKVANARIAYGGQGALADNNRPGWLTRFFQGPLWPF